MQSSFCFVDISAWWIIQHTGDDRSLKRKTVLLWTPSLSQPPKIHRAVHCTPLNLRPTKMQLKSSSWATCFFFRELLCGSSGPTQVSWRTWSLRVKRKRSDFRAWRMSFWPLMQWVPRRLDSAKTARRETLSWSLGWPQTDWNFRMLYTWDFLFNLCCLPCSTFCLFWTVFMCLSLHHVGCSLSRHGVLCALLLALCTCLAGASIYIKKIHWCSLTSSGLVAYIWILYQIDPFTDVFGK